MSYRLLLPLWLSPFVQRNIIFFFFGSCFFSSNIPLLHTTATFAKDKIWSMIDFRPIPTGVIFGRFLFIEQCARAGGNKKRDFQSNFFHAFDAVLLSFVPSLIRGVFKRLNCFSRFLFIILLADERLIPVCFSISLGDI